MDFMHAELRDLRGGGGWLIYMKKYRIRICRPFITVPVAEQVIIRLPGPQGNVVAEIGVGHGGLVLDLGMGVCIPRGIVFTDIYECVYRIPLRVGNAVPPYGRGGIGDPLTQLRHGSVDYGGRSRVHPEHRGIRPVAPGAVYVPEADPPVIGFAVLESHPRVGDMGVGLVVVREPRG